MSRRVCRFLKNLPGIDAHRVAVAGHSFGGQLTLLAAERNNIRAAVTFGAAAASWENSSEVRERLLTAVRKTTVPVMLVHAANDYSTAPGKAMAAELAKSAKPHALKIYPRVGRSSDDGHNFVYTAVDLWEDDVFKFLDQHVRVKQPKAHRETAPAFLNPSKGVDASHPHGNVAP
jgi:dienelactone hydrolase